MFIAVRKVEILIALPFQKTVSLVVCTRTLRVFVPQYTIFNVWYMRCQVETAPKIPTRRAVRYLKEPQVHVSRRYVWIARMAYSRY